jgi:purine-binding chemotaxis protein CheW
MNERALYCTFHIGSQYYGVPVGDVQEVFSSHHITGMPLAPTAIIGLMNIRGQIVPAVAMRKILQLEDDIDLQESMNVVVRHEGAEVSLIVDRIDDVIEVQKDGIYPPPDTLKANLRRFIQGVSALPDRLLLVLDINAVLEDETCRQRHHNNTYISATH